jgi:hypothetical protein
MMVIGISVVLFGITFKSQKNTSPFIRGMFEGLLVAIVVCGIFTCGMYVGEHVSIKHPTLIKQSITNKVECIK